MNLSYIVNNIKSVFVKNDVIETIHHPVGTTTSGEGEIVKCDGYNTMMIGLTGGRTPFKTADIYVEGRTGYQFSDWDVIPVYNSKRVQQPFICLKTAPSSYNDLSNIYFANISGYSEVRVRLEITEGSIGVSSKISTAPFQITESPATVRSLIEDTTLQNRDVHFIGRRFGTEGGKTDSFNLYPIWIGNVNRCDILLENNSDKTMAILDVRMYDSIDSRVREYATLIDVNRDVLPGEKLRISSTEFQLMAQYPGIAVRIRQYDKPSTGTYNLFVKTQ